MKKNIIFTILVLAMFNDKDNPGKVLKPGETLITDDLARVNNIVRQGLGEIKGVEDISYEEITFGTTITHRIISYKQKFTMKYKADELAIKAGPAYQLPFWKVQPRVGTGISFTKAREETSGYDHPTPTLMHLGNYVRAGVVIPLHKGALTLDCDYSRTTYSYLNTNKLSFNLGYQF